MDPDFNDAIKHLNEFEVRCVTGDYDNFSLCLNINDYKKSLSNKFFKALEFVLNSLSSRDFTAILNSSLSDFCLKQEIFDSNSRNHFECSFLDIDDPLLPTYFKQLLLTCIGVAALQHFVKVNISGPNVDDDNDYLLFTSAFPNDVTHDDVMQFLSKNGEIPCMNIAQIKLLFLSHMFLSCIPPSEDVCLMHNWWLLRCLLIYQKVMPDKISSLHEEMNALMKIISAMSWVNEKKYPTAALMYYMECAQMHLYYGEISQSKTYVTTIQNLVGLGIELSGAYGKKTRFQSKAVAQLFVKLKRKNNNKMSEVSSKIVDQCEYPSDLLLQDDTLLNKVSFVDDEDHHVNCLLPEEQLVLLACCLLTMKREAFDELLREEIVAYINCILEQPKVWTIYIKALVMRCKLEKHLSRRVERSLMQLEAVIQSIKKSEPGFSVREYMLYAVDLPMIWSLERDLADLWMTLGGTKSALAIYEKLKSWEDIVKCYTRLGRTSCAEKLIREQLAIKETPYLWCLLGDVLDDLKMYLKADKLANGKNARACRSLGYYYYKRQEYKESIPFFEQALKINPLDSETCFSLGYAAHQCEDYSLASSAYRQAVALDQDDFKAWSNLANAFIRLNQKSSAWRCLKEALKFNYEEWRMWENFLLVSTDIGAFDDTVRAWHRLLDIKGKFYDPQILEILVKAVNKNLMDVEEKPSSRYRKQVLQLLGRLSAVVTTDYIFWESYASLLCPDPSKETDLDVLSQAVFYQQKAVTIASQTAGLETDAELFRMVMEKISRLCNLQLEHIERLEEPALSRQRTVFKLTISVVFAKARKYVNLCQGEYKHNAKQLFNDIAAKANLIHNGIDML
ncbi:tetratricopeptide repeat protein 27 [Trichonephila inaurata madagascariensis]|uniref:Tetratricopeptide repeat protein 27 n=1 Tax=Trichonephila inaurata madagascariensis TaxID=2747483 RepID=A0A8X6YZB5_9ARAC|nr:tetratricopeptide repeat protein 27 [Trichonephila inaurata madagascariensis]